MLQRAQRRLASLHELIDDLLDLAAGKADMAQVAPRRVDLRAAAGEVVDRLRPVAAGKGLALEVEQPAMPLEVYCDPPTSTASWSTSSGMPSSTPRGGTCGCRSRPRRTGCASR